MNGRSREDDGTGGDGGPGEPDFRRGGGLIGLFVRHRTAFNLLMALMLVGGAAALMRINTQFFPDISPELVSVSVVWTGASAEDVSENIVQAIEPEVRFLDGVDEVRATAYESLASVMIEFEQGHDMQKAQSDVEQAIAGITTLPEASEEPEIQRIVFYESVTRVLVTGDVPESTLRAFAERMRDDLLDRGVDKIALVGRRDAEIWAEIAPDTLRRLDLTLEQIAATVGGVSRDLPSGDLAGGRRQVRTLEQRETAVDLAGIEIVATASGERLTLSDIATLSDSFEEGGAQLYHRDRPAYELYVQRALTTDALEVADIVDRYLAERQGSWPPSLEVQQYDVMADLIRDRIRLLVENGLTGLILVLLVLFVFLNGRVAFWVAVGIPVSLLAAVAAMYATGQSINMVSLFGMIMAIGIVVDDAIVVGEHAEHRFKRGFRPLEAAAGGALRMAPPVTASSLTTIAAFLPLFVIGGTIGEIIRGIPLVVIVVILASLVEAFLVLPGHMRHALQGEARAGARDGRGLYDRFRHAVDGTFHSFREGPFRRLVGAAVEWRYVTLAVAAGSLILAAALVQTGRVGFIFFPQPEGKDIHADIEMIAGSSRAETREMVARAERALYRAQAELWPEERATPLVQAAVGMVGTSPELGAQPGATGGSTDTLGGLRVELIGADKREITTDEVIAAWRARIQPLPGLSSITLSAPGGGPPGEDIDVRLSGGDLRALKAASEEIQGLLRGYPGVSNVEDDLPWGAPESVLRLTPQGRALGFDTTNLGRQIRNALDGAIARRFARGDDEITIRVRFPESARGLGMLDSLYVRSPAGLEVPLSHVARIEPAQGFARIKREDGRRQVAITGEIDPALNSTGEVIERLRTDGIEAIATRAGAAASFAGRAEEQRETFADMRLGGLLGLTAIYIILAWVFASYARPLAVMAVIPLGFVGAVIGHMVLGFDITILSMVALIGLSGIIVNDSIILVTTIDQRRDQGGQPLHGAIIDGACDRLRAVLLTSLTTIGGLTPLLFETSLQAQFLIPMAITIVFGLMIATGLILLLVPAVLAIQGDIGRAWDRLRGATPPPRHEAEQPA